MADNIILIGFMGVGKGRTARAFADLTGRFAVDTDDLIESMVHMKVKNIFEEQGESAFRQLEQQAADWLEHHVCGTVVSTGGGFFKVKNLNRMGRVVYLHSSVEDILHSIQTHPNAKKKMTKRPLLQDLEQARKLFRDRLPQYRKAADFEIAIKGREFHEIAGEITDIMRD